ncbi:MAG: hypothetical protein MUF48_09995 [Pirellulaceae bacterium]|jgi:hypothetical protein|nr:hypothetical protein [Pirellulaceae bacterium]
MISPWICWLYQYAVGGALFFGALGLAVFSDAVRLEKPRDRWLVVTLLAGYVALAVLHASWIAAVLR